MLLLSIDPLVALAQTQEQLHQRLLELTPVGCPELAAAWQTAADGCLATAAAEPAAVMPGPEQYLILVKCGMSGTRWNGSAGWPATAWSAGRFFRSPASITRAGKAKRMSTISVGNCAHPLCFPLILHVPFFDPLFSTP
jgi:hypothetical protein